MKHIRTTWAEPVYTIEITDAERKVLADALWAAPFKGDRPIWQFLSQELPKTKP